MEKRNVELSIDKAKEWYKKGGELREVALQAFNEEELKNHRSHSWREFCIRNKTNKGLYYIDEDSKICPCVASRGFSVDSDRNIYPSYDYALAALSMAQLLQVRQEWIGDWKPNWKQGNFKWCIISFEYKLTVLSQTGTSRPLSFPTEEMAKQFLEDFNYLLISALPLL